MVTIAHGGGIPEALSVAVPLAIVVLLLRAGAKRGDPDDVPDETAPDDAESG